VSSDWEILKSWVAKKMGIMNMRARGSVIKPFLLVLKLCYIEGYGDIVTEITDIKNSTKSYNVLSSQNITVFNK
jgi:hypothetical protein